MATDKKRITLRWSETVVYEATVTVPSDYPETVAGVVAVTPEAERRDGIDDWYDRADAQPLRPEVVSVEDRTLLRVRRQQEVQ